MRKKFDLGVFGYPGGDVYCNRAVMEHEDYKQVAFIDGYGRLSLRVKPSYIPADVLLRIEHDAETKTENFKAGWNKYPLPVKYDRLYDIVGITASIHVLINMKDFDMEEKVDFMEAVAFGWLAHSEKVAQAVQDFKDKLSKR